MHSLLPEAIVALAEKVIAANREAARTIVLAESCTGGLVAAALTEVPGSSDVFLCGFNTYSNQAKQDVLGVSEDVIETFGAVSTATAWAMAQGALKHSPADIAVAITGIAGPGGGSEQKPVGTVVFARAERGGDAKDIIADNHFFGEKLSRAEVRFQAVLVALELLLPKTSGDSGGE
jgi:nicotinamide-nucleotide amidase